MRIDLHYHTRYSRDSLTSLDALLRSMGRQGLDMVAIEEKNKVDSLAQGQIGGRLSSPLVHFNSTFASWRKMLGAR